MSGRGRICRIGIRRWSTTGGMRRDLGVGKGLASACDTSPILSLILRLLAVCVQPLPWGQKMSRHRNPLKSTDFTLAHSMNLRRRSEASMRIDAAATQPVFGGSVSSSHAFSETSPITTVLSDKDGNTSATSTGGHRAVGACRLWIDAVEIGHLTINGRQQPLRRRAMERLPHKIMDKRRDSLRSLPCVFVRRFRD